MSKTNNNYRLNCNIFVTVHTPLSREVFWHEYAKIPRHTSQNSIAADNLEVNFGYVTENGVNSNIIF